MSPALGRLGKRRGSRRNGFPSITIDTIARYRSKTLLLRLAIKPVRKERTHDLIAYGELGDTLT